jgi:hypothetical protein
MIVKKSMIVGLSFLAVLAVLAMAQGDPSSGPINQPPIQKLAPPSQPDRPHPVPPVVPSPEAVFEVKVTNFPYDDDGHLQVCDDHHPKDVKVTNLSAPARLIGFTAVATLPNVGVFGLNDACHAEFQERFPEARMCELQEALATVHLPSFDQAATESAWVRSLLEGVAGPQCGGWGSTQGEGLSISDTGVVSTLPCSQMASVACCAPTN